MAKRERFKPLVVAIARVAIRWFVMSKYRFVVTTEDFDLKEKRPYFLIANHPSELDPVYVAQYLRPYPYPVASILLYTKPLLKFALTKLIRSIPKRKGQSDTKTIRGIIQALKRDKRSVMLFPEGNASFFGEQTDVSYQSTAKLIKKLGEDVVIARINGGFLAKPRWGHRAKRGHYHIHYQRLLSSSRIDRMTVSAIEGLLAKNLAFNDYDWNRRMRYPYIGKKRAEGAEHYLYWCPKCGAIRSITTKGNEISCKKCGPITRVDDYGFLTDLPFDDFVSWGRMQSERIPLIASRPCHSKGVLYRIDFDRMRRIGLGPVDVVLDSKNLLLSGDRTYSLALSRLEGAVLTRKNFLSFDYEEDTFYIEIEDPKLIFDVIDYHKGENETWKNGASS
ncbi:MAG: lysophospholipid acyltransferase family protein [Acholeplasmataceae bacterium]